MGVKDFLEKRSREAAMKDFGRIPEEEEKADEREMNFPAAEDADKTEPPSPETLGPMGSHGEARPPATQPAPPPPKTPLQRLGWIAVDGSDGPTHYIDPANIADIQGSTGVTSITMVGGHMFRPFAKYTVDEVLKLICEAKGV